LFEALDAEWDREGGDDFDADVVEVALARIAELAGTSPAWPAQAICEATWAWLRVSASRSVRQPAPVEIDGEAESIEAARRAPTPRPWPWSWPPPCVPGGWPPTTPR